jgi:hypothetical protein
MDAENRAIAFGSVQLELGGIRLFDALTELQFHWPQLDAVLLHCLVCPKNLTWCGCAVADHACGLLPPVLPNEMLGAYVCRAYCTILRVRQHPQLGVARHLLLQETGLGRERRLEAHYSACGVDNAIHCVHVNGWIAPPVRRGDERLYGYLHRAMAVEEVMMAVGCPADLLGDAVQLPIVEVPHEPLFFPAALLGIDEDPVVPPVELIDLTDD